MSHRNQPRVLRACDACTHSKQRCDGEHPCRRCAEREESCHYTKAVRKRGRRPRLGPARSQEKEHEKTFSQESPTSPTDTTVSELSHCVHPPERQLTAAMTPLKSPTTTTKLQEAPSPYSVTTDPLARVYHSIPGAHFDTNQQAISPSAISMRDAATLSNLQIPSDFSMKPSYSSLDPLLPHLKGIITPQEASEMLETYFQDSHNPLFKSHSPYMLAHVLHPSSVLHYSEPRQTSPALIAVILFCVAQTADMGKFDSPGARERTSIALYRLSLEFLQEEDPDNYFRSSDGWQYEHTSNVPMGNSRADAGPQGDGKGLLPKQLGSTDIILAVAILTLTISGGHYKADALKWKDKLMRLVRASGLAMEDQDIELGPLFYGLYNGDATFRRWMISKEERRRLFWLIYCMDRHLSLSFNLRLALPEGTFCVRNPLPESIWQSLDTADLNCIPSLPLGPPHQITGCGFFEYFLPLANLLGQIIDLHHFRNHPTFGKAISYDAIHRIEALLSQREQELAGLESSLHGFSPHSSTPQNISQQEGGTVLQMTEDLSSPRGTNERSKLSLVQVYSTYLIHVFYILLHGKWDPISMIEDKDDWITSESFLTCASHALSATSVVSQILSIDPEMLFMPYLFGIYLLQGSFILLLFVDRMPELGPNRSVEELCETIIRAHEVSVVTLDTTFQKNFRRVFRSMLYDAQPAGPHSWDEHKARRRELLSLYRWTPQANGLAY